jgi:hypothetical protein
LVLVPLAAVLLWLSPLMSPPAADVQFAMPLFTKIFEALQFSWALKTILAMLLVLALAFLLNWIATDNEVTANNYLTALLFIVLTASGTALQKLNAPLFANLFLLLALARIVKMYKTDGALGPPFDAGLLISIASFFYFPAIGMILMLLFAIGMLRAFSWRDYLVAIIGLIIPYLFLSVYYFWFDKLPYFFNHYIIEPFSIRNLNFKPTFTDYTLLAIIGLLVLVSLFDNFTNPTLNRSIRRRKYLNVMVVYLLVSFACFVLTPDWSPMHFLISAVPLSVFISNFLLSFRSTVLPEFIFWTLLMVIVFSQFGI